MNAMPMPGAHQNDKIIGHLLAKKMVPEDAVRSAEWEQRVTGEDIGKILVRNGFLRQGDLVKSRIEIDRGNLFNERLIATWMPPDELIKSRTMLLAETDDSIYVGSLSPEMYVRDLIARYDPREIIFSSISPVELDLYLADVQRAAVSTNDSLLERLLRDALNQGASDIHIIPKGKTFSVMYRRLGVRHIVYEGTLDDYHVMTARIKDNAKMDLSERRVPQGGGFQIEYRNASVDLRVETVPTVKGEYVVIRLLNPDAVNFNLNALGITRLDEWRRGFMRNDGLCLICGPTGAGKTTTLNATIREINRFERAIFTIEDPVEYSAPYVGQMNINNAVSLTFSRALRSFMRADPDVIIIGEVRDEETAANMLKAAETGHLVVATLHTHSIHGAVSRLKEIGVQERDLKYVLRSVLVQRLMRVVCSYCGGKGCKRCFGGGYSSRTIVSECAYFHDESKVLDMIAGKRWWDTIVEDAVKKYRDKVTDRRELLRAFAGEAEVLIDDDEERMEMQAAYKAGEQDVVVTH